MEFWLALYCVIVSALSFGIGYVLVNIARECRAISDLKHKIRMQDIEARGYKRKSKG